jgi:hypothetical protein
MYQAWLAHLFPGLTLEQLASGYWTLSAYVGMAEMARERAG